MRPAVFSVFFVALFGASFACKGCLDLDEYNFDKILSKFKVVLVKFDVSYPYGEKHDIFGEISKEISQIPDLVFAQVGIKDYGDKDNEELGKRYGVNNKDDLPILRLFVQGQDEPIVPPEDFEWSQEGIKHLIRDHSGLYIGLTGCIEEFDKIAAEFVTSNSKKNILDSTLKKVEGMKTEREKTTAAFYAKIMSKVVDKDLSFVKQEEARLKKLLSDGKINDKKKSELNLKLNILKSFKPPKMEL